MNTPKRRGRPPLNKTQKLYSPQPSALKAAEPAQPSVSEREYARLQSELGPSPPSGYERERDRPQPVETKINMGSHDPTKVKWIEPNWSQSPQQTNGSAPPFDATMATAVLQIRQRLDVLEKHMIDLAQKHNAQIVGLELHARDRALAHAIEATKGIPGTDMIAMANNFLNWLRDVPRPQ